VTRDVKLATVNGLCQKEKENCGTQYCKIFWYLPAIGYSCVSITEMDETTKIPVCCLYKTDPYEDLLLSFTRQ